MHWLDLAAVAIVVSAAWIGTRLGVTRLSSSLACVPTSMGIAFVSHGLAVPFIQHVTDVSARTANAIAFSVMLLLSLCAVRWMATGSRTNVQPVNLWLGLAMGAWSAFVLCAIAVVFVSNYPGGRALVNGTWLWRLLNALQVL